MILSAAMLPLQMQAQQKVTTAAKATLKLKEDSLKEFSRQMVMAQDAGARLRFDSLFVRSFVRALQVPNSFYYPFDSVNISKLYAPDSAFRLFTWQWKKDEYVIMQKGAIQMRTQDGKLKLIGLNLYPKLEKTKSVEELVEKYESVEAVVGTTSYVVYAAAQE